MVFTVKHYSSLDLTFSIQLVNTLAMSRPNIAHHSWPKYGQTPETPEIGHSASQTA